MGLEKYIPTAELHATQKEARTPSSCSPGGEHGMAAPPCREQTHHGRTCPPYQCTPKHPHSWVCYSSQAAGRVFMRKKMGKRTSFTSPLGALQTSFRPGSWTPGNSLFFLPSYHKNCVPPPSPGAASSSSRSSTATRGLHVHSSTAL